MNTQAKTAIDKLEIISEITQNQELRQTIKVMVELVAALDVADAELGFAAKTKQSAES